ncbi:MAG TPA: hypothetical protein VFF76_05085 [Holophagaceae bacterium]|jgi:hypothetical protein|nr:hypothetical protein [Holophagaceae bacterium]
MEAIRQDTRLAVDQLQGRVARLKAALWLLFLLVLGAGSYLAWQHAHPKAASGILRVNSIMVVDEHGQVRMMLTANGIVLSDDQGQARAGLQLKADRSSQLILSDAHGLPAVTALAAASQGGSLTLSDSKQDAVLLATTPGPTLQLRRADKVVVKQPYDAQELK